MRRTPLFFICAGLELARYFTLISAVEPLLATSTPQVIRLIAAPNILFAVAFFFLGLDAKAYSAYRPLLLVGKALALLSGGVSLVRLFGDSFTSSSGMTSAIIMVCILAWDIAAAALLAFLPLRHIAEPILASPSISAPDGSPESVEG